MDSATRLPSFRRVSVTHRVEFGGVPVGELRHRLASAGVEFNLLAEKLFASEHFAPTKTRQVASVVEVTLAELGLPDGGDLTQIAARVLQLGLQACPLDLAPHWRLQYVDQPEEVETGKNKAPKGSITVLSPPLSDDEEFPKGFYLRRAGGRLWLRGYTCGMDVNWEPDAVVAVIQP
jgi:hypothetical protein